MGRTWTSVCLVVMVMVVVSGCGSQELSATQYVDQINAITGPATQKGEALAVEAAQVTDFTPQHLHAGLERALREIRVPLQEAADAIEPPAAIADVHHLMWDWHATFISIERALATRAGAAADTVEDWEALSASPEMAAYRAQLAKGKQICSDFQGELDARADGRSFAIDSWLAVELEEIGRAVLGCESFPDHPENVYRYPPAPSTP